LVRPLRNPRCYLPYPWRPHRRGRSLR